MANKPSVGWVGLGKMGIPMVVNLLKAGFPVSVYNRTVEKAQSLVGNGAAVSASVGDASAASDIIISMISDDAALAEVALGPNGILARARANAIYIDMSTVSPTASAKVAEAAAAKGVAYIRAPVSGSTAVAAAGNLTILASGPREAYDRVLPVFEAMGKVQFYVGAGEDARFIKLCLNMMVGITAAMAAEGLILCEAGGTNWQQTIDVVNSSVVASPLIGYKAQALKDRNFAPAFSASQMAKDFDLALETGRSLNVPLPVTSVVRQFLGAMKGTGKGDLDFFAYVTLLEELAGLSAAAE